MTDIQKYYQYHAALQKISIEAEMLTEIYYGNCNHPDYLMSLFKLGKEQEYFFGEIRKLPEHMSA